MLPSIPSLPSPRALPVNLGSLGRWVPPLKGVLIFLSVFFVLLCGFFCVCAVVFGVFLLCVAFFLVFFRGTTEK